VDLDEKDKTVSVRFCSKQFGDDYIRGVHCRRGGELERTDPKICKRKLAELVAERAEWISLDDFWSRRFRDHELREKAFHRLVER
jgi:hypothetical protein